MTSVSFRKNSSATGKCGMVITFSFFPIAQGRRNDKLSLLSHTHALQALVPAFESLQDAQGKPDGLAIVMFVATIGRKHIRTL